MGDRSTHAGYGNDGIVGGRRARGARAAASSSTAAAAPAAASRQYSQREAHQKRRCGTPAWTPRLIEQKHEHGAESQRKDELVIRRSVKTGGVTAGNHFTGASRRGDGDGRGAA